MILQVLRDLEQRLRDEGNLVLGQVGHKTHIWNAAADDLAAVRRTLEARLEGLTRYAVYAREHHRADGGCSAEVIEEVHKAGGFMRADDLEAALVGALGRGEGGPGSVTGGQHGAEGRGRVEEGQ